MNEGSAIDFAALDDLVEHGGSGLLLELSQVFMDDVSSRLAQLELAHRQGDHATVVRLAHRICGGSGSFGAMRMSRAAAALERATSGANHDALLATLLKEFSDVKLELDQRLARLPRP